MTENVYTPDWTTLRDARELRTTAALIYESFWEFYELFSRSKDALFDNIQSQLCMVETELRGTRILRIDDIVVGVSCGYRSAHMASSQMGSLRVLLEVRDLRPDVRSSLRLHARNVEPLRAESYYLSRIAVAKPLRGRGLGQVLLQDFERQALENGERVASLHVRQSNVQARHFYEAAGYRVVSDPALAYYTLEKQLS